LYDKSKIRILQKAKTMQLKRQKDGRYVEEKNEVTHLSHSYVKTIFTGSLLHISQMKLFDSNIQILKLVRKYSVPHMLCFVCVECQQGEKQGGRWGGGMVKPRIFHLGHKIKALV
jgi:hypothetical protein